MEEEKTHKISAVLGVAIIGLLLTGISGIIAVFLRSSVGGGLSLIASAIAFSFMLYIAYK
jgi:hypothetical protein